MAPGTTNEVVRSTGHLTRPRARPAALALPRSVPPQQQLCACMQAAGRLAAGWPASC
mgnify:CR=1 FL=1